MDSAPADQELQGLVDKLEGENQLLQVKNAHLLNLLTESCSNCKSLSATLQKLDHEVARSPSKAGSDVLLKSP